MSDTLVACRYSCLACGVTDREVQVPARGDEDVIQWTEQTLIVTLGRDHAEVSPGCRTASLQNIKIPVDDVDKIGGVVKN